MYEFTGNSIQFPPTTAQSTINRKAYTMLDSNVGYVVNAPSRTPGTLNPFSKIPRAALTIFGSPIVILANKRSFTSL